MRTGIAGIGHTKFGRSEEDIGELMLDACKQALTDANTNIESVDIIYISNFSSSFSNQCHLPAVLASKLDINKEIIRVESACAAGGLALKEATLAIASGLYKNALVIGAEKMTNLPIDEITTVLARAASNEEIRHGATFPSLYALMAQRYFKEYGIDEEILARIAVKNHKNAILNPLAHLHKEITIDDVLNSRVISSPLKLLDCSPISDGAAAVLLCREDMISRFTEKPVFLTGIGHDVDNIGLFDRKDLTSIPSVTRAARRAFEMSKLNPDDIDVAEVHDCFTVAELIEMEDLGFCKKGEGKKMIEEGLTEIGGRIPINPSGGLKAKGHPIGATGVGQAVDIIKQLRGDAERYQLNDAKTGLCCNVGGSGGTCVVSIFSR